MESWKNVPTAVKPLTYGTQRIQLENSGGIASTLNASNFILLEARKNDELKEKKNPGPSLQQYEPTDGQMPSDVLPT